MKHKVTVANAGKIADRLIERLSPGCERIEIAGSIRRGVLVVGDIEIVAIPKTTAFGVFPGQQRSNLDELLKEMASEGHLGTVKDGPKYKQFTLDSMNPPLQFDLFLANPDNWGLIFALRTGPAGYSKKLVTQQCKGGLLNDGMIVHGGYLWCRMQTRRSSINGVYVAHLSHADEYMELEGDGYIKVPLREEEGFYKHLRPRIDGGLRTVVPPGERR